MSVLRCPVPSRRRDDGAGPTPCLSKTLSFARVRGGLLDLPSLLPGSGLLQSGVSPDGTAASAEASQPSSPAESRRAARPSGPAACLPAALRCGSRDGSMSTIGSSLEEGVLLRPTNGGEERECDETEGFSPGSRSPAPVVRVVWSGQRLGAAVRSTRMSRDAAGDTGGDPAAVLR